MSSYESGPPLGPLRSRPQEPLDHLWLFAFPIFYTVMTGYGLFAALFPIAAVRATQGLDRAQIFGGLIGLVGVVLIVGALISTFRQKPHLEFIGTLAFMLLMAVYFDALYTAAVHHESGSRPGSAFLPLLFSIFPFTRLLVILRSGRMGRVRLGPRSQS